MEEVPRYERWALSGDRVHCGRDSTYSVEPDITQELHCRWRILGAFTEHEPQRNRENLQELLSWFEEGKIKTHIFTTYPLTRTTDALTAMMQRKVVGKVVVLPGE